MGRESLRAKEQGLAVSGCFDASSEHQALTLRAIHQFNQVVDEKVRGELGQECIG